MPRISKHSVATALLALSPAAPTSGGTERTGGDEGSTQATEEAALRGGEEVGIVLEAATNGTYESHEDSPPSRVRVLGSGESLRRREP